MNKKFETYKVDRVFGVFQNYGKGLRITLNNNGAEYRVNWAQSYDGDNIKYGIINMLDDNIPVVASYYAPREPLQLYKNNAGALYSVNQKIKSHFLRLQEYIKSMKMANMIHIVGYVHGVRNIILSLLVLKKD